MNLKISIFSLVLALCPLAAPAANAAAAMPADSIIEGADLVADSLLVPADSAVAPAEVPADRVKQPRRILLWGDSMAGVLNDAFRDYAAANGYDVCTATWISSTLKQWAQTDRLEGFLRRFKPDFLVIVLGANDWGVVDFKNQAHYLDIILKKVGNIPYVWIGPANWRADKGINKLIQRTVGERLYFDSSHLRISRRADGIHPNEAGAKYWMNRIAPWLGSSARPIPLRMSKPTKSAANKRTNYVYMKPSRTGRTTAKRAATKKKTTVAKRTSTKRTATARRRTTRRR